MTFQRPVTVTVKPFLAKKPDLTGLSNTREDGGGWEEELGCVEEVGISAISGGPGLNNKRSMFVRKNPICLFVKISAD